ncbi:RDD family protein [Salinarimonas soli]|nr:RDD family protein [Salinarimonas soli]
MNADTGTGDLWHIRTGGQDYGPYTVDQIRGFINEGRVQAQTEIAAAGSAMWTTVAALPLFAALFAPVAPRSTVRPALPPTPAGAMADRAGFGVRAGAILIDTVILVAAQIVVGGILSFIVGDALASLVTMVGMVAYFVLLHSSPQQATIGKRVLGLRLVRDDGTPVTPILALGRYVAGALSALILGIGYLMALRADRKTLHDILCATHVVRVNA